MIEALLEELSPIQKEETGEQKDSQPPNCSSSEDSFLAALPVVEKIVGRKSFLSWQLDVSDMVQGITLRLWKWRDKFRERSEEMSLAEWQSFAARTAYNELNRHRSKVIRQTNLPLKPDSTKEGLDSVVTETDFEVDSLVKLVWQEICVLTLRQRRALLLHSPEVIIYFLQSDIDDAQIASSLDLSDGNWAEIKNNLPFSDAQIADLVREDASERNLESLSRSIKKARHEARKRLKSRIGR